MDKQFRSLEREYEASGDPQVLSSILSMLFRQHELEQWELLAEQNHPTALKYIQHLRESTDIPDDIWVNVYEDFTARSTVRCRPHEITPVRRRLRQFYSNHAIFFQGYFPDEEEFEDLPKDPFDEILSPIIYHRMTPGYEPPAEIVIQVSGESCFRVYGSDFLEHLARLKVDFYPDELDYMEEAAIIRRFSPINRHGQREFPVGFRIVESFEPPEEPPEAEPLYLPTWINSYYPDTRYGGPAEGGWHFPTREPFASIYIGPQRITQDGLIQHPDNAIAEEVRQFLTPFMPPDNVYSTEIHPAISSPLYRPYYQ
jgi:hypothetical protein